MNPDLVLIVDDDANTRLTLSSILKIKGYQPMAVQSGREAVQAAAKRQPGVVLVDLHLDDLPGLDVISEIGECCPHTACIVLTGYASQDSAIQAIERGAYSYVQKPYDVDNLLVTIRRAGERQRALTELQVSEHRFSVAFRSNPSAVIIVSQADGRLIDVNDSFCRIFGYPRAEAIGQRASDLRLWGKEGSGDVIGALQQQAGAQNVEMTFTTRSGEEGVGLVSAEEIELAGEPCALITMLDVTERMRNQAQVQRLLDQQLIVNRLALSFGDTTNLDRIYATIHARVSELMDAAAFLVSFYDAETQTIRAGFVYTEGGLIDVSALPPIPLAHEGRGGQSQVIRTGQPLYLPDYERFLPSTETRYFVDEQGGVTEDHGPAEEAGAGESPRVRSAILTPLKVLGETIGVMQVQSYRPDAYSPGDIELFAALANMSAMAIQNARLYRAAQLRAEQLTIVNHIAQAISAVTRLDGLLETVYRELARVFDPDVFCVAMAGGPTGELDLRTWPRGKAQPSMAQCTLGRAFARQVMAEGRSVLVRHRESENPSCLGVPMRAGDEVMGAICMQARRPFAYDDQDALLLGTISDQVAVSIGQARLYEDRERLVVRMGEQAQQIQQVMDAVPEGVLLLNAAYHVVLANPAGREVLDALAGGAQVGDTLAALGDRPLADILVQCADGTWCELRGRDRVFEISARSIRAGESAPDWVLVVRDMTAQREVQDWMRQQDRLAVIGQLAGGVAHDFNNILTAITGYTELSMESLDPEHPVLQDLDQVLKAAGRAASLTNQLLVFSRKQVLQPVHVSLNEVLGSMEKMLRRLIGENIHFTTQPSPEPAIVVADRGQLEQVIMNLVVNARDAMPDGGQLEVETSCLDLPSGRLGLLDVKPGEYVLLRVQDSGIGMDDRVKAHLFEPFFTTKTKGRGTGLGLATVYGIVKQSGGDIAVESAVGKGTTFRVYLPRAGQEPAERPIQSQDSEAPQGSEVVLLVEDENAVRELARRVLAGFGYRVIEASRPSEAIELCAQHPEIALLVTDVMMPEMNGRALAQRIVRDHPAIRVLYISGYTDEEIAQFGVLDPGIALLEKPFQPVALARIVRGVLDRPDPPTV